MHSCVIRPHCAHPKSHISQLTLRQQYTMDSFFQWHKCNLNLGTRQNCTHLLGFLLQDGSLVQVLEGFRRVHVPNGAMARIGGSWCMGQGPGGRRTVDPLLIAGVSAQCQGVLSTGQQATELSIQCQLWVKDLCHRHH